MSHGAHIGSLLGIGKGLPTSVCRSNHLLRDDILCGVVGCWGCGKFDFTEGGKLYSDKPLVVIDTKILMEELCVIEQYFDNIIIFESQMIEIVKYGNEIYNKISENDNFYRFYDIYNKDILVDQKADPQDVYFRRIAKGIEWYDIHLQRNFTNKHQIYFITDDRKYACDSISKYITRYDADRMCILEIPEYVERAKASVSEDIQLALNIHVQDKEKYFEEYLDADTIKEGLKKEYFVKGVVSIDEDNCYLGRTFNGYHIIGINNLNRCLDGDLVAVEPFLGNIKNEILDVSFHTNRSFGSQLNLFQGEDYRKLDPSNVASVPAKIVGIIRKSDHRRYVGIIKGISGADSGFVKHVVDKYRMDKKIRTKLCIFLPDNDRIPRTLVRVPHYVQEESDLVVVDITHWPANSLLPLGRFIERIGDVSNQSDRFKAILIDGRINSEVLERKDKEDINILFPELDSEDISFLTSLKSWGIHRYEDTSLPIKRLPIEKYKEFPTDARVDLRHMVCFSIDPPGCTDIDDALSVHVLKNGNFLVGVHIADVTHFVRPFTNLDRVGVERCNTVYLPELRIDMLPSVLSSNVCSLMSNVDRLAFSCLFEFDKDANVVWLGFFKTVINSKSSFAYNEAEDHIFKRIENEFTINMGYLWNIAKQLRQKRIENNCLLLNSKELEFVFDKNDISTRGLVHIPEEIHVKESYKSCHLIEEFMLLANTSVAQKIYRTYPNVNLLRTHDKPIGGRVSTLVNTIQPLECVQNLIGTDGVVDPEHLIRCISGYQGTDETLNVLKRSLVRYISKAKYTCATKSLISTGQKICLSESGFRHYGLSLPIYTHFTSPIRRYADIVVHRLLFCAIRGISERDVCAQVDGDHLNSLCIRMNEKNTRSKLLSRRSNNLYLALYLRSADEEHLVEYAYVVYVLKNGLFVLTSKYGMFLKVYCETVGIQPFSKIKLRIDPKLSGIEAHLI